MTTYCDIAPGHPFHGPYHEGEYGFPSRDDAVLFERLILEINQAGLSWLTILKKRDAFQAAFDGFDIDKVAAYGAKERHRLLADAGIIRNRLKVEAAIENARRLQQIRETHGSFAGWLDFAVGLGKPIEVRLEREVLRGRFATLDASGALDLELADGSRRLITAGDVFHPAA